MESADVIIVGGGPAGSTCARQLVRSGADVLVVDKQRFPRDKICAGWVTPPVLETLDLDVEDYQSSRTLQPITGFRTGMMGGKHVETTYLRPVSYGIRRCEFDTYLLRRCGARVNEGCGVQSLDYSDGMWTVNESFQAPLLIGGGGHFCPVARVLGARTTSASVVAAQEVEFEIPAEALDTTAVQAAVPELYFCGDLKGYGWCFRKGGYLNIGLGRVAERHLTEHVEAFLDFLRSRGRIAMEIPMRFRGHAYQLYERQVPRLVDDGVLLIGDAAGLAYPQSGEGIRPAVESGLLAAEVVQAAGSFDRDSLLAYETRLTARLGRPRRTTTAVPLPAGWLSGLAGHLLGTPWFSRHVVIDDWFLHRSQPALIG